MTESLEIRKNLAAHVRRQTVRRETGNLMVVVKILRESCPNAQAAGGEGVGVGLLQRVVEILEHFHAHVVGERVALTSG